MGIFDFIFGKKDQAGNLASSPQSSSYLEKDNLGTQHDTKSKAMAYWTGGRMAMTRKDPFVMFTFTNGKDARAALLELPCIHIAEDSKGLICTERLIYGYYDIGNSCEAILCGDALTIELWELAKASFAKHGGTRKNDLESTRHADIVSSKKEAHPESVSFVKDQNANNALYKVYKGPDEQSAMAFLQQNPVTKDFLYLVVETPEGNFCRDKAGIYREER